MRSIETELKRLEKLARERGATVAGDFCRKHLPPPILIFEDQDGEPPQPATICEICGKPYHPSTPRPVIVFESTPGHAKTPRQ